MTALGPPAGTPGEGTVALCRKAKSNLPKRPMCRRMRGWPNGFDLDSIALHMEMKEKGLLHRTAA